MTCHLISHTIPLSTYDIIIVLYRLNFDYDMRRSSEEGPYSDLIPFDARDVWRFTLEFDDRYEQNLWWADVSTFVNMGRNHRDRCWPWKKGNKLPYKRKANDMPLTGHGPNGEFVSTFICQVDMQVLYGTL